MKKWFVFILLGIGVISSVVKAATEGKYRPVQVSFIPPLSTNGWEASQYTNGFSLNLLAGVSRGERGVALAGITNIILNEAKGFQWAGITNVIGGNGNGFMLAGVLNRSSHMMGMQLAGVGNIADRVLGVQFAGLFNKATYVRGTQIGLVNVADHNDFPIGLINIVRDGEMSAGVTYNETGENLYSFRSGGKYLYGIVGLGFNHKMKGNKFLTEAGLGLHIPVIKNFRIDNELKTVITINSSDRKQFYHHSFAILPAYRFASCLELFGGPALNFSHTKDVEKENVLPNHSLWKKQDSNGIKQLYLGYTVGLRFIF